MRLKDLFGLQTYGFDENSVVEVYDMGNFQEDLENDRFNTIYIPNKGENTPISFGFVIGGTTLVAMSDEVEEEDLS